VSYGKATTYLPVIDLLTLDRALEPTLLAILALLDSLAESPPPSRMLLLVNYRPEYQHSCGSKTSYTQLWLDPLPPVSTDTFLQALLGDDPSLGRLRQLLIACTEGNSFFLEESVRTLMEAGVLVGEPRA
jgi:predicted ATPase